MLGGCVSLCITFTVLFVAFDKGIQMLKREGAYFTSLEARFEELNRSISLSELSKPLFEIVEMKDGNQF